MRRSRRLGTVLALVFVLAGSTAIPARGESCSVHKDRVTLWMETAVLTMPNQYFRITLADVYVDGVGGPAGCSSACFPVGGVAWPTLKVDETYTLTAGTQLCTTHIYFEVPDGYTLYIDGVEETTIDKPGCCGFPTMGDGTWQVVLREKCRKDLGMGESDGPEMGSVVWSVGLGLLPSGRSAEGISIRESMLSPAIYTPSLLVYSPPGLITNEVDVVRTGPDLRQVRMPQGLADVVTLTPWEYEIRFYKAADVGPKINGLYPPNASPTVTWNIKNPSPPATTQLQISKSQGGVTDTWLYDWDSATNAWTLTSGGEARVESQVQSFLGNGDRVETLTVGGGGGPVVSKRTRTFHQFAWGEELVQEVVDPDGAALTTAYTYDTTLFSRTYRRPLSVTRPDGSWEKYDMSSSGFTKLLFRPWRDLAMASADASNSDVTTSTYDHRDWSIDSLYFPKVLSTLEEKVQGQRVAYATYDRGGVSVNGSGAAREARTSYSAMSSTEVAATSTYSHLAPSPPWLADRPAKVEFTDGRVDTYTFERGDFLDNADPSLAQFTLAACGLAERMTVVHASTASPSGIPFKSTKDVTVRNRYGSVVLEETYVYTGSGYERLTWRVRSYSDRGQLAQTIAHTGEITSISWDGDRKASEIDARGIETLYAYDALGRVQSVVKRGVPASGSMAAQPDLTTTYSYDADGRKLTQTLSGGGLSLAQSWTYDKVGRVLTATDPAGLVTSYAYSNGGRTVTATLPGGATRVTDRYLDGRVKSETGTSVVARFYDYGVDPGGLRFAQEYVGTADTSSPRWTKTTVDWLGRPISVEQPGFTGSNLVRSSSYNAKGQLQKESVLSGVSPLLSDRLHEYDELGNEVRVGLDIDSDGVLSPGSVDRYQETVWDYEDLPDGWFRVTTQQTYLTDNSATPTVLRTVKERLTAFAPQTVSEAIETDAAGNDSRAATLVDPAAKVVTDTRSSPGSSIVASQTTRNGLLQSTTPTTPEAPTTKTYDGLGRLVGSSSPRTGTTIWAYDAATGRPTSVVDPAQTVTYEYFLPADPNAGRVKAQGNAAGKKQYSDYNSRGQVIRAWGDTVYPAEYVYDTFGQRIELHTFRAGSGWASSSWPSATAGSADVTRWIFDGPTGLLTAKQDAAGRPTGYTYDGLGRPRTRTWARQGAGGVALITTYSYDVRTGELTLIDYSDSTPKVAMAYDRGWRPSRITDGAGVRVRAFTPNGDLLSEQVAGGVLNGVSLSIGYDAFQRRSSFRSSKGTAILTMQDYNYDSSGRLQGVSSSGQAASYVYDATRGFLTATSFTGGTSLSRTYDAVGRVASVTTSPAIGPALSHSYTYNNVNQRVRDTREDSSYWAYGYNDRGEVISGKTFWSDGMPVAGQQFEYDFDSLGDRTAVRAGGDSAGASLRSSSYTTNSLNQYVQRTVPGAVDITGSADPAAAVTVNGQPTYRRGSYFRAELAVSNTSAPAYPQVNVIGARASTSAEQGGYIYVPQATEAFAYDADGNLTSDGRWAYTWDAENRLVRMEAISAGPPEAKRRLEFSYDALGHRVEKRVLVWRSSQSAYQLQSVSRFVYDGWTLIAELDGANQLVRSFAWGEDRSGTLDGTAGVGGLLLVQEGGSTYQVGYDGNGNVTSLVDAATGTVAASYDYDPLGSVLKATGPAVSKNPFTFSTKYTDGETGLVVYGFRYYNSATGRWLSHDPIEEAGGLNLYGFLQNDPLNLQDLLGLCYNKEVKVVVKSFIQPIGLFPGLPPAGMPPQNLGLWVALWQATNRVFRENPTTDAKDKIYRLYSERTFKLCVRGGKIEKVTADPPNSVSTDVGQELFLTPAPMETWGIRLVQTSPNTVEFAWSGKGAPHPLAEGSFQAVRPRTSRFIWHTVEGKITAAGEDIAVSVKLRRSAFPSHRAWVNGEPMATERQGPFNALWDPHPEDITRVRE